MVANECCDVDAVDDWELLLLSIAALNGSCCDDEVLGVVDNGGGGVEMSLFCVELCCCFGLFAFDFLAIFAGGGPGISGIGISSMVIRRKVLK